MRRAITASSTVAIALTLMGFIFTVTIGTANAAPIKVIVNEFFRSGDFTNNEWTELLLVEDLTAAELNEFAVGDSTSSTATRFSAYQLTGMEGIATNFPKGTIILVAGTTAATEDTSYDPANGDWDIILNVGGSYLTDNGSTGNYAGTDVSYVDNDLTLTNTLSTDGFAVNWDT
ncbi:MAG: hypothetical protein KDD89_13115, partial [Anaerolineales bacterium]|nr:hypothetical protein [Anaerolineales bacterium]